MGDRRLSSLRCWTLKLCRKKPCLRPPAPVVPVDPEGHRGHTWPTSLGAAKGS
jgi:hypothetical protein